MRTRAGWALLVTGFLACPCHLPFTLPLAVALLGGTALGSFLAGNAALVAGLAVVYFIGALWLGFALISARRRPSAEACVTCVPGPGRVEHPTGAERDPDPAAGSPTPASK